MTMEHETGLQRVGSAGMAAFEPRDFGELERLAKRCIDSRLFKVASPDAALVIMLTGASLGLSPVASLRGIHVIEGKSVLSSDLLVAVVLKSGQCQRWTVVETTPAQCVIEAHRKGQPDAHRHVWTMEMAKRAGLAHKDTWQKYPAAMLRARCSSELARIVFPDVMFGVFVEGEIEADEGPVTIETPRLDVHAPETIIDEVPALPAPTCADLAGLRAWYVALGLGADDSRRADEASGLAGDHLSALGYLLNSVEHNAALAGTLDAEAATLHDALAMERSAEGVVRVARNFGGLGASDALRKVMCRYYAPRVGLTGKPAADALRKALATPTDGGPSGTRTPAAPAPADATAAPTAAANDAGATMRHVPDGDALDATARERESALIVDDAAWRAHLAGHGLDMWAIGPGFAKRAETFRAAGTYDARRRATLDALEHCPYFANRGHADLWLKGREELAAKVRPQVGGEVIPLRNKHARARLAAERTGTTG